MSYCARHRQVGEIIDPKLRGDVGRDLGGDMEVVRQEGPQEAVDPQLRRKAQLQVRPWTARNQFAFSVVEVGLSLELCA